MNNIIKKFLSAAAMLLCICAAWLSWTSNAQAARFKVWLRTAPVESSGTFVKHAGGWRYLYEDGTYPVKTWKKIKSNIFYFNQKGYMQTGWQNYKDGWYYLRTSGKKKGMLVTGWKTIKGKRYYFSKVTGARVAGWQEIGDCQYYFNKNGVLQKGKVVDDMWLNEETGCAEQMPDTIAPEDALEGILTSRALMDDSREVRIFIGDSRTVGLCSAVTGISRNAKLVSVMTADGQEYFYGKVSSGFAWYSTSGIKMIKKLLKKHPQASVILSHGVNDLGYINDYIESYQSLMLAYPKAKFVIMSVNPVNTKKYKGYAKPAKIEAFNMALRQAFPNNFLDTYHYLKKVKFQSPDGLHYDEETYLHIYGYVSKYL